MWCYVICNNDLIYSVTRDENLAKSIVERLKKDSTSLRNRYHYQKIEFLDNGR